MHRRKESNVPRGHGLEAQRIRENLDGFDAEDCEANRALRALYGSKLSHNWLICLIMALREGTPNSDKCLTPSRDAKRSRRAMIKWYNDNWKIIGPLIDTYNPTFWNEKRELIFPPESRI
jgi:hypothetical protein